MQSSIVAQLAEAASASHPSQWCQGFFLLSAGIVLSIQLVPEDARRALLDYGPRAVQPSSSGGDDDATAKEGRPATAASGNGLESILVRALALLGHTPHAWFRHFYVASVASSAFWAGQFFVGGSVLRTLATWQAGRTSSSASLSLEQVVSVWGLMALQGVRRLYECTVVMRPSAQSKMLSIHWLLGLAFYLNMGIAVWVEGSHSILDPPTHLDTMSLLSPGRILGLFLFGFGWWQQYACHTYLASLKKYTLPDQGMFRHIVCAHYTCECLIYLGLAMVAAPPGQWRNRTLWCGLIFIAVNLGSTANGTKKWYAQKFGADKVAGRWRMIPYVF
ncbi:hypothetical protein ACRALDRAFT_1077523 [Sodiomyces alcalophilus JCM 7366]|uniref:uncharacterized protein n=1 Tax=Sodiomyces alcalophilus JCM 7366 TaxID=591952 RepID=UPI0039B4BFF9